MHRVFPLGACLIAFATVVATPDAARAQASRSELMVTIAGLTDDVEMAAARVVNAQAEGQRARVEASTLRRKVADRAVAAYVRGIVTQDIPDAYADVVAAQQKELVDRWKAAHRRAVAAESSVDELATMRRSPLARLKELHAELDRLDAELAAQRDAEQRAADAARKRALQAQLSTPSLTPRHKRAMAKQETLMTTYPFGPLPAGDSLPPRLAFTGQTVTGLASWYGPGFNGRATASGAIYDQDAWTVASKELPLWSFLDVSRGDRRVLLLVTDRGPYIPGRVLDLSHAAAAHLGVGVNEVQARVVAPVT